MENILLCFIPFFVAVDAVGVLPIFVALTDKLNQQRLNEIVLQATLAAFLVVVFFVLWGNYFLSILNIEPSDFMIAGGIILFIIALRDILSYDKRQREIEAEDIGAVPIGIPLITGPAVLATSIILVNKFGALLTLFAAFINIVLAGILLLLSRGLLKLFKKTGAKTISKIANLIMSAYAITIIRKGLEILINK